jgi:hypothetical protein
MITQEHAQEALSRAYIHAVAAKAGVNYVLAKEFDYGFDGHFYPVKLRGARIVESGFSLSFQLKCSINWTANDESVSYALKSKNYNDLVTREPDAEAAILILMCLPEDPEEWVTISEDQIILRKCCYFAALEGEPVANENSTKTIQIPRQNLLTAANLTQVLAAERARRTGMFE